MKKISTPITKLFVLIKFNFGIFYLNLKKLNFKLIQKNLIDQI